MNSSSIQEARTTHSSVNLLSNGPSNFESMVSSVKVANEEPYSSSDEYKEELLDKIVELPRMSERGSNPRGFNFQNDKKKTVESPLKNKEDAPMSV